MILGIGADIVSITRVKNAVENSGKVFLDKVFTPWEQRRAESHPDPIAYFAMTFAAKEAILKLMGTGWRGKIAWTDIEIINNSIGQPQVTLDGEVKKIADKLGITQVSVSITHTANFAIASAVALAQSNENK